MSYQEQIIELAQRCARGRYDGGQFENQVYKLAESHPTKTSNSVIADMFKAYAEQEADSIIAARQAPEETPEVERLGGFSEFLKALKK